MIQIWWVLLIWFQLGNMQQENSLAHNFDYKNLPYFADIAKTTQPGLLVFLQHVI